MFWMTVAIPSGLGRVRRIMFLCTVVFLFLLMVTVIHLECYSFLEQHHVIQMLHNYQ